MVLDNIDTLQKPRKLYGTVLIKGKKIINFIYKNPTAPSLADISTGTNLPKPTTLKILDTLCYLGLIRKNEESMRYFLGTELISWGEKARSSFNITSIAMPYLKKLRDETNETVNLGILENQKILLINKLESNQSIKLESFIGGTMELYCSGMGKAVLATFNKKQLDRYFATHKLRALTPHTITAESSLKENLRTVRSNGFATDDEEKEIQVFCIGCTIKKRKKLYGVFSVSLPKFRLTDTKRSKLIQEVLSTQQKIENAL